jgi:hypothetical protein
MDQASAAAIAWHPTSGHPPVVWSSYYGWIGKRSEYVLDHILYERDEDKRVYYERLGKELPHVGPDVPLDLFPDSLKPPNSLWWGNVIAACDRFAVVTSDGEAIGYIVRRRR